MVDFYSTVQNTDASNVVCILYVLVLFLVHCSCIHWVSGFRKGF